MENLRAYVIAIALAGVTGCGGSGGATPPTGCPFTPELLYEETMACVGIVAPPPVVLYESFPGSYGLYSAPETVRINTSPVWAMATCDLEEHTLRHEFVHHLLYFAIGDLTHDSELFTICTGGV